jgi:hypothetical protein
MRVENWNPNAMDQTFENVAMERLIEAAGAVKEKAQGLCPVGTVSRPMYKRGPYANQPWTARDAGALQRTIRIVLKRSEKTGKPLNKKRSVRIYAGPHSGDKDKLTYYAAIVEFYRSYLRRGFNESIPEIKAIVGAR